MSDVQVTDIQSATKAVAILQAIGSGCSIVLTMGSAGVLFTELSTSTVHHILTKPVSVVIDTTVRRRNTLALNSCPSPLGCW